MKFGFIIKNLLLAVAFVIALGLITNFFLKKGTKHNMAVTVPDLMGMSLEDAAAAAQNSGLEISVTDSVFVQHLKRGAVFSQFPKAGAKVKPNRKLDITINAFSNRKVSVPSLIGSSMRQAKAELVSRSLVLGKLNYVPDIATNVVLRQRYRGKDIFAGDMVNAGSVIDLDLGLNYEDSNTTVPDVRTLSYAKASDVIKDYSLNVVVKFPKSVKTYADTLAAVVAQQSPEPSSEPVKMGSTVTITMRLPKSAVR